MRVAFILCVERGPLEPQAELLCRSIRRYGGRYADAPIYSFQPRRGTGISAATLAELDRHGVVHSTELLNAAFHDYPIGNKVLVCAHAEATLKEDVLVFVDTDTIFVNEPAEVSLPDGIDVAVRPAASVLTSAGEATSRERHWRRLSEFLSVGREAEVETELGSRARAYFSSGLLIARRRAGMLGRWRDDFVRAVEGELFPDWPGLPEAARGIRRMDEVSLAATLVRDMDRVRVLDGRYNYLIYRRPILAAPWNTARLEDLVHIHYRFWFSKPGFLRLVRPALDPESPLVRWIEQHLPLPPVTDRPMPREHGA